eukprot:4323876-Amphidinium_carterae.2
MCRLTLPTHAHQHLQVPSCVPIDACEDLLVALASDKYDLTPRSDSLCPWVQVHTWPPWAHRPQPYGRSPPQETQYKPPPLSGLTQAPIQ